MMGVWEEYLNDFYKNKKEAMIEFIRVKLEIWLNIYIIRLYKRESLKNPVMITNVM